MNKINKNLKNILVLGILVSLVFTILFGIFYFNMHMEQNGGLSQKCFMPSMNVLCQMSPIEHISVWQNMFIAILGNSSYFTVLLILFSTLFLISNLSRRIYYILLYAPPSTPSLLYRKRYLPVPSYIQEAFSNGILHPKLY